MSCSKNKKRMKFGHLMNITREMFPCKNYAESEEKNKFQTSFPFLNKLYMR